MNDQFLTQHFLLFQLSICYENVRVTEAISRQIRPVDAGYEYDEYELGEELAACRKRQPLCPPAEIEPDEFEVAYNCFLS